MSVISGHYTTKYLHLILLKSMPKGNTGAKFSLSVNRQTSIQCNLTLLPPEIHTEYTRPKERLERMPATLMGTVAE